MTIIEEILREVYCLVREEGYAPDLNGIEVISFSTEGYAEFRTAVNYNKCLVDKFMGRPIEIDGRQEVKFRVICKPTDD